MGNSGIGGRLAEVSATLARGGFIAAAAEAGELLACAADDAALDAMVQRRLSGEPLAWITGSAEFCGMRIRVHPGVYVPRPQSEALAERAAMRLPATGLAVDLCTGSGAIARVLMDRRPSARVLACDVDAAAVACARDNGVDAYAGDLFDAFPGGGPHDIDVVVAVVPYVPDDELEMLQRDTFTFESTLAYDGGPQGTAVLRRLITDAAPRLRPGGALLLEIGGRQDRLLRGDLADLGYTAVAVLHDEDGDVRGIEATRR